MTNTISLLSPINVYLKTFKFLNKIDKFVMRKKIRYCTISVYLHLLMLSMT